MTGLLAEAPRDLPRPRRVMRSRHELALRYLWIAALIMAGTMGAIWVLSPIWDPFDMRERGLWDAYRGAFPWVLAVTAAGEAIGTMIGRARHGEPLFPEEQPPDRQPGRPGFRSLARLLAAVIAVIAVIVLALAVLFARREPSGILGTDPQGAARTAIFMAGGLALAAVMLWQAGRDR